MQLSRRRSAPSIGTLPAACLFVACHLVPGGAQAQGPWHLGLDTLVYGDTDDVLVVSPQASVRRELDDDGGEVGARMVVDTISAASVDVVSHATSRFNEIRYEGDLSISKAFGDHLPSLGYRGSVEPDYVSHGFHAGLRSRLGSPDSVMSLGYGVTFDTVGRHGTSFDNFSESLVSHAAEVGLTQVLGPESLLRAVYALTVQSGFMEKPYRHVPLFDQAGIDRAAADGVALDLDGFERYSLDARPPEEVPDLRIRHALALRAMHFIEAIDGSLRLDYQIYLDDWGLVAHALEPGVHLRLADAWRLAGFGRLYLQSAASFWQGRYVLSQPDRIPRYRSVDRDLSGYLALTGGARIEWEPEPFALYLQASVTWTRYDDFMFLDQLVAFVGQAGVRWTL
jgi:hypothetical protein